VRPCPPLAVAGPDRPVRTEPRSDHHAVSPTVGLGTQLVGQEFLVASCTSGTTLYEPFGGLCAGLEMVLRNGWTVDRYLYSDIDPAAVAMHRMRALAGAYPGQLQPQVFQDTFAALPQDVREIDSAALVAAGGTTGCWLMVAGWECQDLSPAGTGSGLRGLRSRTFYDAVRIVGALQQLLGEQRLAYLIENTAVQHNFSNPAMAARDWPLIAQALGDAVLLDAVQVGSHAHRLRNYWTNLACTRQLVAVLSQVSPPADGPQLLGDVVVDPDRLVAAVSRAHSFPYFPVNVPGQPRRVWPTLVAYPLSRAFLPGMGGSIWVASTGQHTEPSPDERERALGYNTSATAAPGVTEQQRHTITGRCMDAYAMQSLLALSLALRHAAGDILPALGDLSAVAVPPAGSPPCLPVLPPSLPPSHPCLNPSLPACPVRRSPCRCSAAGPGGDALAHALGLAPGSRPWTHG
jgi:hypothetical protein